MARIWRDWQLALRTIWRSPGYAIVTAVTMALAIGANTLLFSIANPLVLRELPIKDPDRLGWIYLSSAEREIERGRASLPEFLDWRRTMTTFASTAAFQNGVGGTLTGHGDARRIETARVTTNLQDVWGLTSVHGRLLHAGEDEPGRPLVGVLSHRFWREAFDADRSVIGRTYALDGQSIAIVGVMEPAIEIGNLSLIDLWVPLPLTATAARDVRTISVIGRLAPGATLEAADAELQTIFSSQSREYPHVYSGWRANVRTTKDALAGGDTWVILGLLSVVVLFVLLIACANLANLVMARIAARRRELEVRRALGASTWLLIQPVLLESQLLGVIGGLAALAVAYGGLRLINAAAYDAFLRQVGIDGNVLAFAAILSLLTPLVFTLYPALTAGRESGALQPGLRATGTRSMARRRRMLIGSQVALALSLLVLSALVTQSLLFLRRIDPGFAARSLLTYRFDLPETRYPDAASRSAFIERLQAQLAAIPGATGAAAMTHLPVIEGDSARSLSGTLRDGQTDEERPWASWFAVTSGFFEATGIEVLAGRPLDSRDLSSSEPVAVINRLAAERYFETVANPIGRRISIHDATLGERPVTIVGVVANTRDAQLTRTSPQIYVPFHQWSRPSIRAIVRSADPTARAADTQAVMRALDPEVAVADLKPVSSIMDEELAGTTIINGLFVSYAVLALLLAASGLFGVISYSVAQRRREIGVRLALGASPRAVARMVVREGLAVTLAGTIAGLVLALILGRLSASVLFGIDANDPPTYAAVVLIIFAVALLASWAPAMRAMRVDPVRTLRAE